MCDGTCLYDATQGVRRKKRLCEETLVRGSGGKESFPSNGKTDIRPYYRGRAAIYGTVKANPLSEDMLKQA